MKWISTAFILVFIAALLAACSIPYEIPYGIWKSNNPDLMLSISEKQNGYFKGIYVKDGEPVDVFISFLHEKGFDIQTEEDANGVRGSYFYGTFKVDKNQMHYRLKPHYQEITGYETIIFEKIEDYETT